MKKHFLLKAWEQYYDDIGLDPDVYGPYLSYVRECARRRIPPIFGLEHLAKLLGREIGYVTSVVFGPSKHYRTFEISKRRGGKRKISAPYPALLECQQWINTNILQKAKLRTQCTGFRKGKSIISNAEPHIDSRNLLKLDLKNFFDTIELRRVIGVFRGFGYPSSISFYLASLCCLDGRLPQGAATSPTLSNICARELDKRLGKMAKAYNIKYTRYADDMTFSGNFVPLKFQQLAIDVIESCNFVVNEDKTMLASGSGGKKVVTGVSVATNKMRLPRQYKRKLRQEIHYVLKFGVVSHSNRRRVRDPNYLASLLGKIEYWLLVEPKNKYALSSRDSLRELKAQFG